MLYSFCARTTSNTLVSVKRDLLYSILSCVHLYVLSPSCAVVRHRNAYTPGKSTFQEREEARENKFLVVHVVYSLYLKTVNLQLERLEC